MTCGNPPGVHPYFGDDGDEGRCECGYAVYPKGGPPAMRHMEHGVEAATVTIRAWLDGEDVSGPNLCAELAYWLDYWGGLLPRRDASYPHPPTMGAEQ